MSRGAAAPGNKSAYAPLPKIGSGVGVGVGPVAGGGAAAPGGNAHARKPPVSDTKRAVAPEPAKFAKGGLVTPALPAAVQAPAKAKEGTGIRVSQAAPSDTATSRVTQGIERLHANRRFADVRFRVGKDYQAPAHRAVLVAASSAFADFFDEAERYLQAAATAEVSAAAAASVMSSAAAAPTSPAAPADPAAAPTSPAAPADPAAPPPPTAAPPLLVPPSLASPRSVESAAGKEALAVSLEISETGLAIMDIRLDKLDGIRLPEAVDLVLAHVYGANGVELYSPSSSVVNREVLRMSCKFGLDILKHRTVAWLAQSTTEQNIVESLETCAEFELAELLEELFRHLTESEEGLGWTHRQSEELSAHPWIARELLLRTTHAYKDVGTVKSRGACAVS